MMLFIEIHIVEEAHMFEIFTYLIVCTAVVMYVVLDGFDLGVGALHLFAKKDQERRVFLNAIGPVWDGNEVWLVIIFGALFAGFPLAYATICSAFYTPIMILLAGVIFRAVAIEFRSKIESPRWRSLWDGIFSISSIVILFLIGIILGNLIVGIPLDGDHAFLGSFSSFFSLYPIVLGITSIALFMMHGSIYLLMKTEGTLHKHLRNWVKKTISFFVICYLALTALTFFEVPSMIAPFKEYPLLIVVPLLAFLLIANVIKQAQNGRNGWAFLSSSLSIILLFALAGIGTFPTMIVSSIDPENSITLYQAVSNIKTLKVIFVIACIGVPLVLAYGVWIYHIFRGKVTIDASSY